MRPNDQQADPKINATRRQPPRRSQPDRDPGHGRRHPPRLNRYQLAWYGDSAYGTGDLRDAIGKSCWSPGLSGGRPDSDVTGPVSEDLPEPEWIILFVGASHGLLKDRCSDTGEPARFTMVTQHHFSATSDVPERDVHPQPTPTRLDLACSARPSCAPRAGASPAEPAGSRPAAAGVPPEAAGPAGPAASPEPGGSGEADATRSPAWPAPRQPARPGTGRCPASVPPCQGCHAAPRSHQRRSPDRPPRPQRDHLAPARRMAPRAGLDDPVRSRLWPARPGGLTNPEPLTTPTAPSPRQTGQPRSPQRPVDKPQKWRAAGKPPHGQPQDQVLRAASKKTITRIYPVDRGLGGGFTAKETSWSCPLPTTP